MRLKFIKGLTGLVLVSALFSGCGSEMSLDSTSIGIRKDGSVFSAVYEAFDTSVYDEDELKAFVESAVNAYNQESMGEAASYVKDADGKLSIAIDSVEVKSGEAVLKMEYASCDDYMQFNASEGSLVQLASGTVAGAAQAGIDLSSFELLNTEGTEKINGADVEDEYYVVFAEGNAKIVVDGTIQYTTSNVTIEDKHTAEIASTGELSCVIYK